MEGAQPDTDLRPSRAGGRVKFFSAKRHNQAKRAN